MSFLPIYNLTFHDPNSTPPQTCTFDYTNDTFVEVASRAFDRLKFAIRNAVEKDDWEFVNLYVPHLCWLGREIDMRVEKR